jgi:hypothetical protein
VDLVDDVNAIHDERGVARESKGDMEDRPIL